MQTVRQSFKRLLQDIAAAPDKSGLDALITRTLEETQPKVKLTSENWKSSWEYALREEMFRVSNNEGQALKDPKTTYYSELYDTLDLVLIFTEKDACEQVFPCSILYDLLETQTIISCSHIFSWVETRADRLTKGMVPQKGKSLVLLRALNDLLRRLSKMGSTTLFCGRILTFLSQVFPLGERSGVNLRGEFGPAWDGPGISKLTQGGDVVMGDTEKSTDAPADAMQVDEPKNEEGTKHVDEKQSRKDAFIQQVTFASFKEAVNKVLPVIREATAKERALMGSKANLSGSTSLKRKREPELNIEPQAQQYFFAKYLTSPELLDLEIADTHFRRQFLLQLLILLNFLLTYTAEEKSVWQYNKNRSLWMNFTLEPDDAQWAQEMIQKASDELRQTTPSGRAFAETVHVILQRERNWVNWKNNVCFSFDKVPWAEEVEVEDADGNKIKRKLGLEEATREARRRMRPEPEEWPHEYGSAALTEIWLMGYRDLSDLQRPFQYVTGSRSFARGLGLSPEFPPGDIKDYVKKIKQEDARIDMRKKQLAKTAERIAQARAKAAASAAPSPAPTSTPAPAPAPTPGTPAPDGAPPRPSTQSTPAPGSAATPPLHPSLPAKPGTVRAAPAQETPAPAPVPAAPTIVAPTPTPAVVVPPPIVEPALPPDDMISKYEESKQRWTWLALRTARDQYLQHFGKIGTGDILQLAQEIENEKIEREKALRDAAANPDSRDDSGPAAENKVDVGDGAADTEAKEGTTEDVKMET
ncbi:hypothetical protein EIP86_003575 [Pleurotus ostreatoroseus]|nr:hypothetical protein EIP86_003575 [Pleurotus ostreatoroseus]